MTEQEGSAVTRAAHSRPRVPFGTIGKVGIDTTKPPIYREGERRNDERMTSVGVGEGFSGVVPGELSIGSV